MLVLSRTRDETVVVVTPQGDVVDFMIVDTRGEKVRVGVRADPETDIHRKELVERIMRDEGLTFEQAIWALKRGSRRIKPAALEVAK